MQRPFTPLQREFWPAEELKKQAPRTEARSCRAGLAVLVIKSCDICGAEYSFRSSGQTNNNKRRFCTNSCAAKWRMQQPGRRERMEEVLGPIRGKANKGRKRPDASERMKRNNPMKDPQVREKARLKNVGRTFLARGGNGQPTVPQLLLHEKLGLPMEYAIPTTPVKGQFPSLPTCYKVDLADPLRKLAIEVDGKTHSLKKWRFLDARKTAILNALGWSVLRFSNERVMQETEAVVREILNWKAPE